MVLAIGLVVDDAIVVVEAVEYELKYNGLSPKEAAIAAMKMYKAQLSVLPSYWLPYSYLLRLWVA